MPARLRAVQRCAHSRSVDGVKPLADLEQEIANAVVLWRLHRCRLGIDGATGTRLLARPCLDADEGVSPRHRDARGVGDVAIPVRADDCVVERGWVSLRLRV